MYACFFSRNPLARGSAEARRQFCFILNSNRNMIQCTKHIWRLDKTEEYLHSLVPREFLYVFRRELYNCSVQRIRTRHRTQEPSPKCWNDTKKALSRDTEGAGDHIPIQKTRIRQKRKGRPEERTSTMKKFAMNFHLFSAVCFTQALMCRRCVLRVQVSSQLRRRESFVPVAFFTTIIVYEFILEFRYSFVISACSNVLQIYLCRNNK